MTYGRKVYRSRSYHNRDKYSIEQAAGTISFSDDDGAALIVPSNAIQGMRKVKHITISLTYVSTNVAASIWWAIVYVPAGTNPNTLNVDGTSLYEPNQFVMNAGVWDADAGPNRISSPVSRNLNSGDQIYLVLKKRASSATTVTADYCARYAVTLQ